MDVIKVMDETLASQVAAGEVVERPASIVRELVENSIDASATKIEVFLQNGGKSYIQVIDNGVGMTKNDALLSIERHSSSKLKTSEDLNRIKTMGFRGEALPSISSVSRFELLTKKKGEQIGTRLIIEGGKIKNAIGAGVNVGTNIIIRDIFFNIPARRKYLRAELTEYKHIEQYIKEVSISFPHITFSLTHRGKRQFLLPKDTNYLERIRGLVGSQIAMELIEIPAKKEIINIYGKDYLFEISGFLSSEKNGWKNNKLQYFYINNRCISDNLLKYTLREAYKGFLNHKLSPISFIFLKIPPDYYDINVHPTKKEVRFININKVQDFIYGIISRTLSEHIKNKKRSIQHVAIDFKPEPKVKFDTPLKQTLKHRNYTNNNIHQPEKINYRKTSVENYYTHNTKSYTNSSSSETLKTNNSSNDKNKDFLLIDDSEKNYFHNESYVSNQEFNFNNDKKSLDNTQKYHHLGNFNYNNKKVALFNHTDGLVMMDISASLQRIYYEHILNNALSSDKNNKNTSISGFSDFFKISNQEMLIPVTLELPPIDYQFAIENKEYFKRFNIFIHDFGINTIKVDKIPSYIGDENKIKNFIIDLINNYKHQKPKRNNSSKSTEFILDNPIIKENMIKLAKSLAKNFNHYDYSKNQEDSTKTLNELLKTELPYCSPSGNTTLALISKNEILKKFSM